MKMSQVALEGRHILMEPLEERHRAAFLEAVATGPEIFRWYTTWYRTPEQHIQLFEEQMAECHKGARMAFVTLDRATRRLVGGSSYVAISPEHHRLEIGSTWIIPEYQRTYVNTEAKLLQLTDCFERLGCNRVELKTDSFNTKSQQAMLRLGCKQEGTHRRHMVCEDGRIRDSVYFSIISDEWPEVRQRLTDRLSR